MRPWYPNTKSTGRPGDWTTASPIDRPGHHSGRSVYPRRISRYVGLATLVLWRPRQCSMSLSVCVVPATDIWILNYELIYEYIKIIESSTRTGRPTFPEPLVRPELLERCIFTGPPDALPDAQSTASKHRTLRRKPLRKPVNNETRRESNWPLRSPAPADSLSAWQTRALPIFQSPLPGFSASHMW